MHSYCSFWHVLVLKFLRVVFLGLLLLSRDTIFMLSRFFLTTSDSRRTLNSALVSVSMRSTTSSMWAVTKLSYSSFGECISDIS